ncbi:hypothetical protein RN001_005422 [Aquatica leii]|uniref:Myb/SANT-like DNA-binding domain-containing protein n=1 Tax=Aquatica leii TaxID=1421715 RepID=A0AAN7SPU9_9COLE|nr:hypothetical protein RN001_005422 [Aquatica leii]
MNNSVGLCSICGMQGDMNVIQKHFVECHITDDSNSMYEIVEESTDDSTASTSALNKSNMKWNDKSIKLLLTIYQSHLQLFRNSKKTNKSIWSMIAEKMQTHGYQVSWDDCDIKFRNLKKTYKRIKDNDNLSGRGAKQWIYFNIFEELFGKDADVKPLCVINTSNIESYSNNETSDDSTALEITNSSTPTSSKKRKCSANEEPAWVKKYREDANARHNEKMKLLQNLIDILKK